MRRVPLILLLATLVHCGSDTTVCDRDGGCALGNYCEAGACLADCDAETSPCSQGVCTQFGRCVADQPDPNAGLCAALVAEATFGTPTVVLLVDQSGSMKKPYPGGSRWSVLRDTLIDPQTGLVARLQQRMRFGVSLYTNVTSAETCPQLIVVDPALNNLDAISSEYNAAEPKSNTPTGESVDQVVRALRAYAEPGPKYIIIASDGLPDTCAVPKGSTGQPETVAAVQAAYAEGIEVYFLSVGSGSLSQEHMQDVANAGIGLPIGGSQKAPFFQAADALQLTSAFDSITDQLLSCDLQVNGVIDSSAIPTGVIYLDGQPLTIDEDWRPIDETSFRLLGAACSTAQAAGPHTVTAHFACEAAVEQLSAEGGGVVDGGCAALPGNWWLALAALFGFRRRRSRC